MRLLHVWSVELLESQVGGGKRATGLSIRHPELLDGHTHWRYLTSAIDGTCGSMICRQVPRNSPSNADPKLRHHITRTGPSPSWAAALCCGYPSTMSHDYNKRHKVPPYTKYILCQAGQPHGQLLTYLTLLSGNLKRRITLLVHVYYETLAFDKMYVHAICAMPHLLVRAPISVTSFNSLDLKLLSDHKAKS